MAQEMKNEKDNLEEERWEGASVTFHYQLPESEDIIDFHVGNLAQNASHDEIHQFGKVIAQLRLDSTYLGGNYQ